MLIGNIQFDDPTFAFFCSEYMITSMEERKIDHEALMDSYIRMYNEILVDKPSDLNVGVHMCRGNYVEGFQIMPQAHGLSLMFRWACISQKAVMSALPPNCSMI